MDEIKKIKDWVFEKRKNRTAEIVFSSHPNYENSIWVYDYDLDLGQYIRNATDIDLEYQKEKQELDILKRLKEKYMNKDMMKSFGFDEQIELVENNICPFCKKQVDMADFRNDISLKEYNISGLCQKCQDNFFGID